MRRTTRIRDIVLPWLWWWVWIVGIPSGSLAMPMFLLDSGRARCVTIDAPQDRVIRILYEAPDAILDRQDPNYGPLYLTVSVQPANRVLDTKLHESPITHRLKPKNELISEVRGSLSHTFEVDGTGTVCIRSAAASPHKPLRFGLRILDTSDEEPAVANIGGGKDADVDSHLTHMEKELSRIDIAMRSVLKEANYAKERDAIFHKQTQAMHSATMFWPIVQVCVLLMTGFTQASHIVNFFKSRRIF